jgi:hypothetical protein
MSYGVTLRAGNLLYVAVVLLVILIELDVCNGQGKTGGNKKKYRKTPNNPNE